mgnify:FL=1
MIDINKLRDIKLTKPRANPLAEVSFGKIRLMESKVLGAINLSPIKFIGNILSGELLSSLNSLLAKAISTRELVVNPNTILTYTSLYINKVIDYPLLKNIVHFLATNHEEVRQNRALSVPHIDENSSEPGWLYAKFTSYVVTKLPSGPQIEYELEIMNSALVGHMVYKTIPYFSPIFSVLVYKAGITNRKIKSAMPNSLIGLYICVNVKKQFNSDKLTYFEYKFDACSDNQNREVIKRKRLEKPK